MPPIEADDRFPRLERCRERLQLSFHERLIRATFAPVSLSGDHEGVLDLHFAPCVDHEPNEGFRTVGWIFSLGEPSCIVVNLLRESHPIRLWREQADLRSGDS